MKKFITLLLAFCLFISFTACSNQNSEVIELQKQINSLEERVVLLEEKVADRLEPVEPEKPEDFIDQQLKIAETCNINKTDQLNKCFEILEGVSLCSSATEEQLERVAKIYIETDLINKDASGSVSLYLTQNKNCTQKIAEMLFFTSNPNVLYDAKEWMDNHPE